MEVDENQSCLMTIILQNILMLYYWTLRIVYLNYLYYYYYYYFKSLIFLLFRLAPSKSIV